MKKKVKKEKIEILKRVKGEGKNEIKIKMSMSMSMSTPFNAKVYVSSQLNNQLLNTAQTVAIRCVEELSKKYDFDAEEEIRLLGLDTIKLERKGEAKSKAVKAAKESVPKPSFPLPYNGEYSENMCNALRQNSGLYTQCTGERNGESAFCKGCLNRMQKLGSETPEYGTIQQRQEVDILAYVDPQGRKPIAYTKIMNKYKKSKDDVLEEATKFGITIDERHFIAPEQPKRGRPSTKTSETVAKKTGVKGRPKKSKKVITIQGDDEDLFAALVAEANEADSQDKAEKEAEKAEKEAKRVAEKEENGAEKCEEKENTLDVSTFICGSRVIIVIFRDIVSIIEINSEEVAKSYKGYFEILWSHAN